MALALAAASAFGVGARAQTGKSSPKPPPTLGEALGRVPWDKEQGVLLAIGLDVFLPGAANPYSRESASSPPDAETDALLRLLQAPPNDAGSKPVRLSTVARAWKRSLQTFGSVTVAADAKTVVLNPKPGPPNLLADVGYGEVAQALLASLSSVQWRIAAGKSGIGRGDLQENQVAFFDRLVPEPLTYVTKVNPYYARHTPPSDLPDASPKTLSPDDRRRIRIHAKLQTEVSAPTRGYGDENSFASILSNGNRGNLIYGEPEKGGAYLALVYPTAARRGQTWLDEQSAYGVVLAHAVRNAPKPSDLDFSTLSDRVSLSPPQADAQTRRRKTPPGLTVLSIADLMPRLQKATGLELYADARLRNLEVGIRGADSAAAGSLLQALCLSIGGTLRKVEAPNQTPAYVLTSDREGQASRFIDVDTWWAKTQREKVKIASGSLDVLRAADPLSFLPFDENEPVKLSRDQLSRVAVSLRDHKSMLLVKPSDLTPVQLAYLNRQVANSDLDKGFELKGDRYKIGAGLWLGLVLPGGDEITSTYVGSAGDLMPAVEKVPTSFPASNASLWARVPDTGDEKAATEAAVALVEIAARHQMQALYLQDANPKVLQAAAERAAQRTYRSGEKHLSVWGVLQPLRAQPGESIPIDRNARQQTSREYEESQNRQKLSGVAASVSASPKHENWRVLSAPETIAIVQKEATEMARIPGLGGILISDALPPGYRARIPSRVNPGNGNPGYDGGTSVELGWTPAQRLQFLREKSADPLDIVPYFAPYDPVQIPYFPNASHGSELADTWANWRAEKGQAFLKTLRGAINTAHSGLPVRICSQVNENIARQTPPISWLIDWPADGSSNLRLYWTRFSPQLSFGAQAKQAVATPAVTAPRALLCLPAQNTGAAWARGGQGWDGFVLDFSQLTPDTVAAQLDDLGKAAP